MKLQLTIDLDIEGDPTDAYFSQAAAHLSEMAELIDRVRKLPREVVIFDVGANIGLSAIAMAVAQPFAKIYAFEPNPTTFAYLRRNVGPFRQIEAVQAAVSAAPGVLRFSAEAFSAGSHVVGDGHMAKIMQTVEVESIRLDDFARSRGVTPDFIKLDVEGHEPEAIAGAQEIIEARRIPIYMEFNSWTLNVFAGHSPAAFARAIWERFDVEGYPDPVAFMHENLTANRCVSDVVLQLKPGARVPTLAEMSFSPEAYRRLETAGLLER